MKMFEKKRLHPVSALLFTLKNIKDSILPVIIVLFFGNGDDGGSFFEKLIIYIIPLVIFTYTIIQGFISWYRFVYWIEDEELRIEQGWIIRKKRYIPFDRIQSFSTSEGIIQRAFRLVKMSVETAGGGLGEPEAVFTAITKTEAQNIETYIKRVKAQQSLTEVNLIMDDKEDIAATSSSVLEPQSKKVAPEFEEANNIVYQANFKEILLLALSSGGALGVLGAAAAFISQFDELIPYEKMYTEVQVFIANSIVLVIMLSLIVIILSYFVAVIRTVLKYGNYTVEKTEKNLIVSHGLLEIRKTTVPLQRIQGIEIIENPIRNLLGLATLFVINEGGGNVEERGKVMICPLIKKKKIAQIVKSCLPNYEIDVEIAPIPSRAKWRYLLKPIYYLILPICMGAYFLRPWGLLLFLILPVFLYFGYASYRFAGWNITGNQLTLRSRFIQARTFYSIKTRIQAIETSSSWFQRRKQLGTVQSSVMSGVGRTVDIDEQDIRTIYHWYSRTTENE